MHFGKDGGAVRVGGGGNLCVVACMVANFMKKKTSSVGRGFELLPVSQI